VINLKLLTPQRYSFFKEETALKEEEERTDHTINRSKIKGLSILNRVSQMIRALQLELNHKLINL
jgi:hypothetical protein